MSSNPSTIIDIRTGAPVARGSDTGRAEDYLRDSIVAFSGTVQEVIMSSEKEIKAVNVRPPRQGEILHIAIAATQKIVNIPSAWTTKFMTFKVVGGVVKWQCGGSGDTLSLTFNQASGGSTPHDIGDVNNATGATLSDGQQYSFRIYDETQLAFIGDAADGYVEIHLSTQPDNA